MSASRKRAMAMFCLPIATFILGFSGCSDAEPMNEPPVAEEPNKGVPYLGVDGAYTSDPLAADCPDDPRNAGRVVLWQMKEMSFFTDREGTMPIAEKCVYDYKGYEPDPHYFPEFVTSVWLVFEQSSGPAGCEAYKHVVMRPPHGDGAIKHMHLRYGDAKTTAKSLLEMSAGDYEDSNACDPWWSVYCTAGSEGCDG